MSNLLIDYSQQITEQTRERVTSWEQTAEGFSRAMNKVLEDLRATLDSQPTVKTAAAVRKKQAAAPRRARTTKKG